MSCRFLERRIPFAALIRDGSDPVTPSDRIVAWGDSQSGGRTDYPTKLPKYLAVFEVKAIHSHFDGSNNGVFIAEVRGQGSQDVLHAWGDPRYGALVEDVSEQSAEPSSKESANNSHMPQQCSNEPQLGCQVHAQHSAALGMTPSQQTTLGSGSYRNRYKMIQVKPDPHEAGGGSFQQQGMLPYRL